MNQIETTNHALLLAMMQEYQDMCGTVVGLTWAHTTWAQTSNTYVPVFFDVINAFSDPTEAAVGEIITMAQRHRIFFRLQGKANEFINIPLQEVW